MVNQHYWENLIIFTTMLVLFLGVLIILKDKVELMDISLKIGIFSLIVAMSGGILEYFVSTGYALSLISMTVFIMCIIVKIYALIFGHIKGALNIMILTTIFISFSFELISVIIISTSEIVLLRNISIGFVLLGILIKAFLIIFIKKEKHSVDILSENNYKDLKSEHEDFNKSLCGKCGFVLDQACKFCPKCGEINMGLQGS